MLHRNGTPPAPDLMRGKAVPAAARTEFLPDRPADTPRSLAYHLSRQQLAGIPLIRWLYGLLVVIALVLLLRPGFGWWFAGGVLLVLAVLWSWMARAAPVTTLFASRLGHAPSQTQAGSRLGRCRRPTSCPSMSAASYRWIPRCAVLRPCPASTVRLPHVNTRLLCQARPRRFGALGTWPEEEQGLWYAFFQARQVRSLQFGEITFDRASFPGRQA